MSRMKKFPWLLAMLTGFGPFSLGCGSASNAAPPPAVETTSSTPTTTPAAQRTARPRPLTRLFFEDHATQQLRWATVLIDGDKTLTLESPAAVPGVPPLDAERQKLVQMRQTDRYIVLGIRDDDGGQFASGWTLVDSGVSYRDHGDHGHWSFRDAPSVLASQVDAQQGNPAHVYEYDGRVYVANDQKGGYTRIDPLSLEPGQPVSPAGVSKFIEGGGNHITLAVVDDKVGYSCWIDGGGPRKGQVDVTLLSADPPKPAYSLALPTGGIHGAIANSGKVFFAPSDGICWVEADLTASQKPEDVTIRHISLGSADGKPRRTGAFVSHGRYVIFVTGKGADTHLAIVDAAVDEPSVKLVPLSVKDGGKAVTPAIATTPQGAPLAFVFHDHDADLDIQDQLEIVELDPNGDGDCRDLRVLKSLAIGPSAVEGHNGHHAITFDADRRFGFFTNPGDGTITALSLLTLEPAATFPVGGKPTAIIARGSRDIPD
ncbi:MAG: hypothetical protein KF774_06290 [Planctomyces sp.]|nr:hypothetical protein [Planctomyces sp.]